MAQPVPPPQPAPAPALPLSPRQAHLLTSLLSLDHNFASFQAKNSLSATDLLGFVRDPAVQAALADLDAAAAKADAFHSLRLRRKALDALERILDTTTSDDVYHRVATTLARVTAPRRARPSPAPSDASEERAPTPPAAGSAAHDAPAPPPRTPDSARESGPGRDRPPDAARVAPPAPPPPSQLSPPAPASRPATPPGSRPALSPAPAAPVPPARPAFTPPARPNSRPSLISQLAGSPMATPPLRAALQEPAFSPDLLNTS